MAVGKDKIVQGTVVLGGPSKWLIERSNDDSSIQR